MGRWLSMLENEKCTEYEPTKPTKPQKSTLVGLVGSGSGTIQKNKSGRWLSQIEPKNTLVGLVGSKSSQKEKIKLPKVWRLKIRSSDGKSIDAMSMIDKHRMSRTECKAHLARQFGKDRVLEFKEVKG